MADSIERLDSLSLVKAKNEGLAYAQSHKRKSYTHTFTTNRDTSFQSVTTLRYGHLLSKDTYLLMMKRNEPPWHTLLNIYILKNGQFRLLYQGENIEGDFEFLGDTLRDINGDGYKDYVIHLYPSSGCCRRNVYRVLLFDPHRSQFGEVQEFINPTFYPRRKLILGVEYGQPGEVPLYKFRWNGMKIDTIEFIHILNGKKGRYLRTTHDMYLPTAEDGIVLKSVPKEYRSIEDFAWFMGKY